MPDTRLIICGSIAMDRIMNFSGSYHQLIEPSKLETLSISVLVDSLNIARGGTGANIAYTLAELGEKPVLLGSVGQDGQDYITSLSSVGIDVTNVHISDLPTASFSVLTDANDNQVGGFYPGAMNDTESLSFEPWAEENALFCVSAHGPDGMRTQVQQCVNHKLRLFYDPGQQVSNVSGEDLKAGIEAAEVVIVNDYELSMLFSKTGYSAADLAQKVPVLISTHGKDGSVISGNSVDEPIKVSAAKPATITDPTGAGDAYRAGFLYGYLRQWDLKACGQLGSVLASFVLEHQGPQVKITPTDIIERYKQTFNEEIAL